MYIFQSTSQAPKLRTGSYPHRISPSTAPGGTLRKRRRMNSPRRAVAPYPRLPNRSVWVYKQYRSGGGGGGGVYRLRLVSLLIVAK